MLNTLNNPVRPTALAVPIICVTNNRNNKFIIQPRFHNTYRHRKVPIGYNGTPQKYPFPWTDPQTLLPASSPRPTYDAERHPDLIRHFSTMHCTDRQIVQEKFDDYRPLHSESNTA